jgi:hypothetical protein
MAIFYRQTYDFTCGPACLIMAFSRLGKRLKSPADAEIDLWREGALLPMMPTTRYGLAFSAKARGLGVEITTNVKMLEYLRKKKVSSGEDGRYFRKNYATVVRLFRERRKRVLEMGASEVLRSPEIEDVKNIIDRGGVPILLTSSKFYDKVDWAHWIVVASAGRRGIFVDDPSRRKGNAKFSLGDFEKINGYHGDKVLIGIFR